MSGLGVSGCFGGSHYEQIDTVEEVSTVVDELQSETASTSSSVGEEYMLTVQQLAGIAQEYARRIRILTYGLIAVVAYLVIKELKS